MSGSSCLWILGKRAKIGKSSMGGRIQDEENPMNGSRILSTAMFREGRKLVDASTRKKAMSGTPIPSNEYKRKPHVGRQHHVP